MALNTKLEGLTNIQIYRLSFNGTNDNKCHFNHRNNSLN